ncbi:MAG: pyridoxal phosphate-dependent aminotransferase [Oscillospiraceae bacterium]|nr:pyridoxal phosphate-dependent aminotransferase [Oscillospiraceae bacterium]
MNYNFDEITDRRNTHSLKWDVGENELPMWVADMDFKTAPEITGAIVKRAEHGVFGYNTVPDEWYDAYIKHWQTRYDFKIEKDRLIFCTGVVPAISSVVRKLTTPAENVLILTPVYNIFFNSIINNGRKVLQCPLKYDGKSYGIDFEDLEKKLADPQTSMMIFCNPHNPVGKIWDKETLQRVGSLCLKHHVIVVSDEIHCDLTETGKSYIPFASVSEECKTNSITCVAPTKSFNLAGLQTAAVIVPDEYLRNKVNRGLNTDEVAEPNSFAVWAAVAAYNNGSAWLDELRLYIDENRRIVSEFIQKEIPQIKLVKSEATYLLWLDCGGLGKNSDDIAKFIRKETGLYLSGGTQYGKGGEQFLRLNIACPKKRLTDGLERLKKGVSEYIKR